MKFLSVILAILLASTPCSARPRHWYTDWHTWAGEAVIVGALVADGRSTCTAFNHGLVEGNFLLAGSHNCGQAVSVLAVGGGIYTGLHIWDVKLNETEPNKYWRFVGHWSIPIIACSFHCTAAALNYEKINAR
jgi:hypothetical protein